MWGSNPQPFALLTQCSTTEPQEHTISVRTSDPCKCRRIHTRVSGFQSWFWWRTQPVSDLITHSAHDVDDGRRAIGLLAVVDPRLLADQRPQLVQVNGGAEESVPLQVVMSHAHLPKITGMTAGHKQQLALQNNNSETSRLPMRII